MNKADKNYFDDFLPDAWGECIDDDEIESDSAINPLSNKVIKNKVISKKKTNSHLHLGDNEDE